MTPRTLPFMREFGRLAMGARLKARGGVNPPVQDDAGARNIGELPGRRQQFHNSLQSIAQRDSGELRDPPDSIEARQLLHALAQSPLCLAAGYRQADGLGNALVELQYVLPVEVALLQALEQQLARRASRPP